MVVGSTPAAPNRKKNTSMTIRQSLLFYPLRKNTSMIIRQSLLFYPLKAIQEWQKLCVLYMNLCSGNFAYYFEKNPKFVNNSKFENFSFLIVLIVNLLLLIIFLENLSYGVTPFSLLVFSKDLESCASLPIFNERFHLFGERFDERFLDSLIKIKSCFILRVSGSQKKEVQKASQLLYQQFNGSLSSAVPFSKISEKKKSFVVLTSPHKFKQGGEHLQWLQTKYSFTSPACTKEQLIFLYSSGNSLRLKGVQLSWDIKDRVSLLKTCGKKPLGPKELQRYGITALE